MTARRDPDRLIRTYLDDGPTELADRSYDAVRDQVDHIRQRAVFGPWREPQLSKYVTFAIAAAAVLVVVAVVGISSMAPSNQVGAPQSSASPTSVPPTSVPTTAPATTAPSPTADASVIAPGASPTAMRIEPLFGFESGRRLAAGTYYVDDPFPVRASFTVPGGWDALAYYSAATQVSLAAASDRGISLEIVDNVTANPCTDELLDPPVGPSVDELVTALSSLAEFGFAVSPATDVTFDGFRGKQLTVQAPVDGPCENLRVWRTTTRQNGVAPGEINEVRILDVDGVRLMIAVAQPAGLSPAARSELDAVLESIQIGE